MTIKTIPYQEYINSIPPSGNHIIGQHDSDQIIVYQAYTNSIADFAVDHQFFGGPDFSYNRMSWIKPNFLWMMYRSGWCSKQNQERVLAIHLSKKGFDEILKEAVYSSFVGSIYNSKEIWKKELATKKVRLQWDPDHDIYGNKQERRAIQLGLKGNILKKYGVEFINKIEDITKFVKAQKKLIDARNIGLLEVPQESIYLPKNVELCLKLGLD